MISITSYAKGKKSSSSSTNAGGGFANAQIYNNGFNPFYLWGQYIDGRDTINGDLISNGTINGNKFVGEQGNIDLIYALSEYVNYISGHTAVFDNLSGDTAHFNQDVYVGGDIDIVGDTNITGDTTIYGDLAVSGDTHLKNIWTQNINNSDTIKTKNLEVTGLAHFFQLVIDRIKAAGGAILLTPADGFETALVEEDASGYTLYFHAKDGEKQISNMWEVNDQAICQTFNASTGTSYNVSNTYYWALVTEVSEQAVQKTVSGVTEEYHYIKLSKSIYDGELNPKIGDEIAMLGSRNDEDPQRQSAIYMAAYTSLDQGLTAPCFAEYKGINDFSLSSHRHSYIDATGASFTGDFRIDNNTTIQDYVNSATTEIRNEFRFDTEGLYSRVSKMTNPNILPANGWTDQDDKALLQEDDEEYIFEEPQQQSMAKGGFSEDVVSEDLIGMPPIIYLNADTYTFSIYSQVKFEDIQYGYTKDNLNMTLPVQTAFNSGDTWHSQARAITTFVAPIDGYYHLGAKIMGSDYTGDYEWVDPDGDGESGYTPTESGITTSIEISMQNNKVIASVTPSDFSGTITWQSSNPTACTIDQEGNLTVLTTGSTVITASIPEQYHNGKHYLGSNDTLNLSIQPIQINYTSFPTNFGEGDNHSLNASTNPTGGTLTYSSSNPSVASVDNNGVVTAIASGTTVISITSEGVTGENTIYTSATKNVNLVVGEASILTNSNYFVVRANSATTLDINVNQDNQQIHYRKNGSGNWNTTSLAIGGGRVNLVKGDYLEMVGNISNAGAYPHHTTITTDANGDISIGGYLMALHNGHDTVGVISNQLESPKVFENLFENCSGLTSAEHLTMADNTTSYCYNFLFYNCTNLVKAPSVLPATSLATGCYEYMFNGCTSLTTPPQLPATILQTYCYSGMFMWCKSLVTAPSLPATTLTKECYRHMFWGCTSLINPPVLPATTLEDGCYFEMFGECTSLTSLTVRFSSLGSAFNPTEEWLIRINTTGICYCPSNAIYSASDLGLPSGWTLSKTLSPEWITTEQTISYTSLPQSSMTVGGSHSLNASAQGTLSYSSSNSTVATVNSNGVISALTSGNTTITITATAYDDNVNLVHYTSATTSISVDIYSSTTQTISYTSLPSTFNVGDTHSLGASTSPTGGTLSYSSSNSSVASVNSSGVITALATGTTTITITASAYDDDTNFIHYTSATTSVTCTVQVSTPLTDSKYFVMQALTGTIVSLNTAGSPSGSISYRKNGTGSWTTLSSGVSLAKDDYIELKGNYASSDYNSNYVTFSASTPSSINIGGYLAALQNNAEIDSSNNTVSSPFSHLFSGCTGLVSAEYLNLPSNTVFGMYYKCFQECTNLVTSPRVLPETIMKGAEYQRMFYGCSNLETTPIISATTVEGYGSFQSMFYYCGKITSLTIYFTSRPSQDNIYRYWLSGVNTTGVCYCPSSATYSASDISLPSTWTLSKTL